MCPNVITRILIRRKSQNPRGDVRRAAEVRDALKKVEEGATSQEMGWLLEAGTGSKQISPEPSGGTSPAHILIVTH